MTKPEFITADQIISDFVDDQGISQAEVEEGLLTKWIDDVVQDACIPENMIDSVALIPIRDYKADIPDNVEMICEVAYREKMKKSECKQIGYQISQWKQRTCEEGCELEINLVCPECHKTECDCTSGGVTVDIDYLWADAHPELYYKHYSNYIGVSRFGYGNSTHSDKFRLMTPSNNPWEDIKHLPGCANIHCKSEEAMYSIDCDILNTSIKDGWVLISYLGRKRSPKGEVLIDISNRDLLRAITEYLTYKYYRREYNMKREGSSKQISSEAYQLHEMYFSRYLSAKIVPPAEELMNYFASSKFVKICRAMENYMDGDCPVPNMPQQNVYRNRV